MRRSPLTRQFEATRALAGRAAGAILIAVVAGYEIAYLNSHLAFSSEVVDRPLATGLLIIALALLNFTAEKTSPLRALSEADWVFKARPKGTIPASASIRYLQLAASALLGALLGLVVNHPLALALFSLTARLCCGLFPPKGLPQLLSSGRSSRTRKWIWLALDADYINDVFTSSWLVWPRLPQPRSTAAVVLFRIVRQPRLLTYTAALMLVFIAGFGTAPMPVFYAYSLGVLLVAAQVGRCARFDRLGLKDSALIPYVLGYALIAFVPFYCVAAPAHPWVSFALFLCAVVSCGVKRSAPHETGSLTFIETGFGFEVSPQLFDFFLRGLLGPMCLLSVVAFLL